MGSAVSPWDGSCLETESVQVKGIIARHTPALAGFILYFPKNYANKISKIRL